MTKLNQRSLRRVSGVAAVMAIVLAPVAVSAVSDTDNTTITANVASTISVASSGTVTLNITPTGSGASSSSSDTVTVSTNSTGSMTLTLEDTDATVALSGPASNSIAASAGTQASPITLANNTWGYRVNTIGGFTGTYSSPETNVATLANDWAGVPASGAPNTIKTVSGPLTNNTTTVWYGAKSDTSKAAGAYTDTVVYTASAP
jgi:hypothetical protein